jgi:hypothetical protein
MPCANMYLKVVLLEIKVYNNIVPKLQEIIIFFSFNPYVFSYM